jgi:hypothetical protein
MRFTPLFLIVVVGCSGNDASGGTEATPPAPNGGAATVAFTPARAEFSAAFFVEAYCSGCHQPNYVSPSGRQVSLLSTDPWWHEPFENPNWFEALDYWTIVKWGDAIRCGVQPYELAASCTSLPELAPGFFSGPRKFPPAGRAPSAAPPVGDYGSAPGAPPTPPPVCAFAADGHTCPQPSLHQRTEMVRWIEAGFPE